MLAPDDRRLLLDALVPPDGYALTDGVVTTYSLDLDALLLVPSQLVGGGGARDDGHPPEDRIGIIGALKRAAGKVSLFCQDGRISDPARRHPIYALLEPMIVCARARNGGEFHPKTWLLRFSSIEVPPDPARMRLLVLSRNLTFDRCWDVSVSLDGTVRGRAQARNRPLSEFIGSLPAHASHRLADVHAARVQSLSEEVRLVEWELPEGFDDLQFHAPGAVHDARPWLPAPSQRLVVISPFVTDAALKALAATSEEPVALISRPEELDSLGAPPPFDHLRVLHDRAETEDGDDASPARLVGLHAKVYLAKQGSTTRIIVGSANATTAAIGLGKVGPRNVEFMAELSGRTANARVRGIDELLGEDGLGPLLTPWSKTSGAPADPDQVAAERALDVARRSLTEAGLSLSFQPAGDAFRATLRGAGKVSLEGLATARVRLMTAHPEHALGAEPLTRGESVSLPECDLAACTGFLGVELEASRAPATLRFVLALPTDGIPVERDAHIVRAMIGDEGRFVAYVVALLGMAPLDGTVGFSDGGAAGSGSAREYGPGLGAGLLERLLRAKSRDPRALEEIADIVAQLSSTVEGARLIPPGFMGMWEAIRDTEVA